MLYNNKLYYYNYETAVRGHVQIFKQEGQWSQTVVMTKKKQKKNTEWLRLLFKDSIELQLVGNSKFS